MGEFLALAAGFVIFSLDAALVARSARLMTFVNPKMAAEGKGRRRLRLVVVTLGRLALLGCFLYLALVVARLSPLWLVLGAVLSLASIALVFVWRERRRLRG